MLRKEEEQASRPQGLEFRGLGFRGLGFRVQGLGFGFGAQGSVFRV